jgi:membrane protein implicated in regulation of membrane protease activity
MPHLRMPSLPHGVVAFVWSFLLALYVWIGLLAIGTSQATSFVFALLSFAAIFLFVRLRGEDRPGRD